MNNLAAGSLLCFATKTKAEHFYLLACHVGEVKLKLICLIWEYLFSHYLTIQTPKSWFALTCKNKIWTKMHWKTWKCVTNWFVKMYLLALLDATSCSSCCSFRHCFFVSIFVRHTNMDQHRHIPLRVQPEGKKISARIKWWINTSHTHACKHLHVLVLVPIHTSMSV